jgi:hypothetical protein
MTSERDQLVLLARRLETLADDTENPEVATLLADFNRRTGASTTLHDFRTLYASQEPEEFVDGLLEARQFQPAPGDLSRDDLVALVARAYRAGASWSDGERAGQALAARSALPPEMAHQLGSGWGPLPFSGEPEELVDFALSYRAPSTAGELLALARLWAQDWIAGKKSLHAALGGDLVKQALSTVPLPELAPLMRALQRQREALMRAEMIKLGLVSSLPEPLPEPPPAEPSAPAAAPVPVTRRFRHPKFGEGELLSEEGEGAQAKVTIRFRSGDKTLLASFVEPIA